MQGLSLNLDLGLDVGLDLGLDLDLVLIGYTERSGYMGIGYRAIPGTSLIFGWTRTKWAVIQQNILVIRDVILDIWLILRMWKPFSRVQSSYLGWGFRWRRLG